WNLFQIALAPPLRGAQALSRWYRPRCSWPPPPSQITRRDPPGEPRAARVERPKLAATDRHMRQAFKFIAFCRAAVDATEHRAAELLVRDQDVAGNFNTNVRHHRLLCGQADSFFEKPRAMH